MKMKSLIIVSLVGFLVSHCTGESIYPTRECGDLKPILAEIQQKEGLDFEIVIKNVVNAEKQGSNVNLEVYLKSADPEADEPPSFGLLVRIELVCVAGQKPILTSYDFLPMSPGK